MTYEERLKKLLGNNDPFWYVTIDNFVKTTSEDKDQAISELEALAKDSVKFNDFTKQLLQKRDDLKSVKNEFLGEGNINVQKFVISTRKYNGHYGKGSVFKDVVECEITGRNAKSRTFISFCIDEKITDKASLECSLPFDLNEEEIFEVNKLLNEIKSNYQPYDSKAPRGSIPEYLKYTDININGVDFAINSDDEILVKLKTLIKYDFTKQTLSKSYNALINNQEKDSVNTTIEKCQCGNAFELIWAENQKFQIVRCPKCDVEIKFRNPKATD